MWALCGAALAWLFVTVGERLLPDIGIAAQSTGIGVNCALAVLAPGLREYGREPGISLRLAGGLASAVLCLLLAHAGWSYFTLPFVLTTWVLLIYCKSTNLMYKWKLL
jgi:urea transporter